MPSQLLSQVVGVNQDVNIYSSILPVDSTVEVSHCIPPSRAAWIQVATGAVQLKIGSETVSLEAGDGVGIDVATEISISRAPSAAAKDAEFVLFDLA